MSAVVAASRWGASSLVSHPANIAGIPGQLPGTGRRAFVVKAAATS